MSEETRTAGADVFSTVVSVDLNQLCVMPEQNDATRIAAMMAKCLVPLSLGGLEVPERILSHFEEISARSETILPIEALNLYKMVVRLRHRMLSSRFLPDADTGYDLFLKDAVARAPELMAGFVGAVSAFIGDMEAIKENMASETHFFMTKSLGTSTAVDPSGVIAAVQNLVQALNTLASGFSGYQILSLLKLLSEMGRFMDDAVTRQYYGVGNRTALMNKLGYRILPGHVALSKQLDALIAAALAITPETGVEKEETAQLFMLADSVKKGLSLLKPQLPDASPSSTLSVSVRKSTAQSAIAPAAEMIGKNVMVTIGAVRQVGQIVDVIAAHAPVPLEKRGLYFSTHTGIPEISTVSAVDRVVIQTTTMGYMDVRLDGAFKSIVAII